jgi:hypothetical protein
MKNEENVYEDTTPAEDVAEAKVEEASTVLGKFKDVSALERAYECLQAEFTRRSQKLRELEREVENFKQGEASGAEKLRKNAKARKEAAKEFDAFVADMGAVSAKAKKPTEETGVVPEQSSAEEGFAQKSAFLEAQAEVAKKDRQGEEVVTASLGEGEEGEKKISPVTGSESGQLSTGELFERAVQDEAVRLRIIGEYLTSLGKSEAPLTAGGKGVLAAPPIKAKSVGEAGDMALLYFRKYNE